MMEDFNSETDSDYASYWRDWVGLTVFLLSERAKGGGVFYLSILLV